MNANEQEALARFKECWYSMPDACEYLGVSNDATLDHHVREGNLPCVKMNHMRFFAKSDLDALQAMWTAKGGRRPGRPKKR